MKKIVFLLIITQISSERMGIAQNLQTTYSETRCGLNFTQASVLLGKRMAPYGYPYYGIDQPAPLVISGIPEFAKIEKAFLWWDIAGSDTLENVILKNPALETDTFSGNKTGGNSTMCWGPGRAFRADVTSIVSGNGTYNISGLPTDTTFDFINKNDVNGATLFIIYSDPSLGFLGNLIINDGYVKISLDTLLETMNFSPPTDTSTGKAFMILSDMQGEPGNKIKMNNGPFTVPSQDYWDFEQKNTVFVSSINYSIFGVQAPSDCIQLIATGIYFQSPVSSVSPIITRSGDILTSSPGSAYQWYINDSAIANANFQNYLASLSGIYYVEVTDSFGCMFSSDTITVTICAEKIKPNINFSSPDSLWTDSVNYSLQWFLNGNAIPNANLSYYIATATGSYWVQVQDTTGCSVSSNIISVSVGMGEAGISGSRIYVFPNPNEGKFEIRDRACPECAVSNFEIYNLLGEKVYQNLVTRNKDSIRIDISNQPSGIYFLKIHDTSNFIVKRIVVY